MDDPYQVKVVLRLNLRDLFEKQISDEIRAAPRKQEFVRELIRLSYVFKLLFGVRKEAYFSPTLGKSIADNLSDPRAKPDSSVVMALVDRARKLDNIDLLLDAHDEFEGAFIESYKSSRNKQNFLLERVKVGFLFRSVVLERKVMSGVFDSSFLGFVWEVSSGNVSGAPSSGGEETPLSFRRREELLISPAQNLVNGEEKKDNSGNAAEIAPKPEEAEENKSGYEVISGKESATSMIIKF